MSPSPVTLVMAPSRVLITGMEILFSDGSEAVGVCADVAIVVQIGKINV